MYVIRNLTVLSLSLDREETMDMGLSAALREVLNVAMVLQRDTATWLLLRLPSSLHTSTSLFLSSSLFLSFVLISLYFFFSLARPFTVPLFLSSSRIDHESSGCVFCVTFLLSEGKRTWTSHSGMYLFVSQVKPWLIWKEKQAFCERKKLFSQLLFCSQ